MCRPFGRTHALRRMIPGMVTLIVQDPIRVHLYRHVVIMIQDDRSMTSQKSRSTVQVRGYHGNQSHYNSGDYLGNRSQYNSSNYKGNWSQSHAYSRGPGSSQSQYSRGSYQPSSRDPRQQQQHHNRQGPPNRLR